MENLLNSIMSIINDDELYFMIIAKQLREKFGLYFTIEPVVGNRWTISYADLNVHGEDSDYINEEESRKNGGYKVYDTYLEAVKIAIEKLSQIGREKYNKTISMDDNDMTKHYLGLNAILAQSDNLPKNVQMLNTNFQYDADTTMPSNDLGLSDDDFDPYWKDKKGYCDYEYEERYESNKGMSPRGEWYKLVLVRGGKIIAFGEEQGNYAGGVYASNDFNYPRFLKEKEQLKEEYPELYEQIKDIPLAEENEYPMYKSLVEKKECVSKYKNFMGVLHTHRYDIPDAYNQKLGYIYRVLLYKDNELIAVGEKHPIKGESLIIVKDSSNLWTYYETTLFSAYKDINIEDYKVY